MLRVLPLFFINMKRRLVKSPKIYLRDSGILHDFLDIRNMDDLSGHPVYSASREGMVIENILQKMSDRTAAGAELDLVLEKGRKRIGVECKASLTQQVTRGFRNVVDDLELEEVYIISPVRQSYPVQEKVTVSSLHEFLKKLDTV